MSEKPAASPKKRVVVLLSGNGSNLQALLDQEHNYSYHVVGVISNVPEAYGLERARQHKVAALGLDYKVFSSRGAFDQRLVEEVNRFEPDLVVLAGYMKILSPEFVEKFAGRLINVHPSLLPEYKGLGTYRRVLADKKTQHGCTVHFVTPELDSGTHIIQASLSIGPNDNEDSLKQRVQAMEHRIYPLAVHLITSGRLQLTGDKALLDDHPVDPLGYQLQENALELA
ncbi:phosphoribosylglycinamide formyltransferase [Endozoicomonas sp. SCSIO W0465]|uniref:phosphoribosylglycinamide formyltransferase n=1 Tax=Endozoicomonas sp. SCSIO W0465 TaxID=2918516 RepID=UPI002074F5F7|nr:phosphoribosylglycinamide formyltransferase [Endozoicomonas sp. SCSIO W0465]USE34525.1 phosphoribosylglycinamide formyltransferase [Endozoicomonas sp. SCSIO W0465]